MRERTVVLGPCPCHDCGTLLYWDGWEWRGWASGHDHECGQTDEWRAAIERAREPRSAA